MYIGALRSKITAKRLPFLLLLFFTAWTRTNVCSWIPISSQHWLRGLLCVCGWEFAPRDPLSVRFASQCRDRVLGTNLGAHVQDCAGNAAERHIRRKWGWSYQRREGEKFDIILIVFNLNLWKITNKITKSWFFFFEPKPAINKQKKIMIHFDKPWLPGAIIPLYTKYQYWKGLKWMAKSLGEINPGWNIGEASGGIQHARIVCQGRGEDSVCVGGSPRMWEDEYSHKRDQEVTERSWPWLEGKLSCRSLKKDYILHCILKLLHGTQWARAHAPTPTH